MSPISISFRFKDNGRFHDDLVLQVDDRQWRCDSYYLLIDNAMMPEQADASKVHAVLRRLLEQWSAAVARLDEGQMCYLPFDFSDQSTRWLRCRADETMLRIQPGWTAQVCGWALLPSDVGELVNGLPGFRPEGDEVLMSRQVFLRSINSGTGET